MDARALSLRRWNSVEGAKKLAVEPLPLDWIGFGNFRMDLSDQNGRLREIAPGIKNFLICAKVKRCPLARQAFGLVFHSVVWHGDTIEFANRCEHFY